MKLKTMFCALALTVVGVAAKAEDFNQSFALTANLATPGDYSAGWGVTHSAAGAFTDTITFTGTTSGWVNSLLSTLALGAASDINFTSVSLNGNAYTLESMGSWSLATLPVTSVTGPLTLTVSGIAAPTLAAGTAIAASYSGTVNVTAVPEPESAVLLLAGLGIVGLLGRRRIAR